MLPKLFQSIFEVVSLESPRPARGRHPEAGARRAPVQARGPVESRSIVIMVCCMILYTSMNNYMYTIMILRVCYTTGIIGRSREPRREPGGAAHRVRHPPHGARPRLRGRYSIL